MEFVRYRTFPLAGRRGTTVLDRSTAYPLFGERAGRAAWQLVQQGTIDLVHGFGASVLGYARRRAHSRAPLVLNPQGLEEFGATAPSRARLKRAAYLPLRLAVRTCARAADCVIATDRGTRTGRSCASFGRTLAGAGDPECIGSAWSSTAWRRRSRPPRATRRGCRRRRSGPSERRAARAQQRLPRNDRSPRLRSAIIHAEWRRGDGDGSWRARARSEARSKPRFARRGSARTSCWRGGSPIRICTGGMRRRICSCTRRVRRQLAGDAGSDGTSTRR